MPELKKSQLPKTLAAIPTKGGHDAILEFGGEAPKRRSFDEIFETADKLSAGLLQRIGEGATKRPIILFAPASTEAVIAAAGILRSGQIVAPVDTQMPDEDLRHVLKNADPRLVFTTKRLWHRLKALKGRSELECFLLDTETDESRETGDSAESKDAASWHCLFKDSTDKVPEPDPADIAVIFYTSGTTGPPKGVPLSHKNILFQMEAITRTGMIKADDRLLQPLPPHHVYPFVIGTLAPLAFGVPVILPGALTGNALAVALQEGEATVTLGVPRLYKAFYEGIRRKAASMPAGGVLFHAALALAKAGKRIGLPLGRFLFRPLRKKAAPRLRLLASGGSPFDPDLARNLEALGWPVTIGYGLTETAPLLTVKKPGEASFDSIGRGIEGVELRIDPDALETNDEKDAPDSGPSGAKGELLARGPNVFSGYYKNEHATKASFTESGWFRTGDVATIDRQGVIRLSGRVSTRIALQGGENVDPAALEEHYEKADGVEEIGILEHDSKLAALVVPEDELINENAPDAAEGKIREALKKQGRGLPSYQQLSHVEISARKLARTRLGKLRRHELEETFEKVRKDEAGWAMKERRDGPLPEEAFSSQDRVLLENHRARALWDLLCERYPDRPLAPDAELKSELGIDSLEWVELSLAIETSTGASVDEAMLARVEQVRDLLEAIAEADEGKHTQAVNALGEPASTLDATERKWAEERGPMRHAIATVLFSLVYVYLRLSQRVEAEGLENPPEEGPCILTPNHVSYLDAPCLGVALGYKRARRFFWAGFTGIMFRNAFIREISRLAQVVPVNARRGPVSSLAMAAYVLQQNKPLVWFPEGGISRDGSLQEFLPGIGLLLEHYDVPVVPVYIEGARAALPKGKRLPRRSKVRVRFGQALEASALRGDASKKAPKAVAEALRKEVQKLSEQSNNEEDPA
ncbi:MAG: AMP-binding protein [Opitutales bacterium]